MCKYIVYAYFGWVHDFIWCNAHIQGYSITKTQLNCPSSTWTTGHFTTSLLCRVRGWADGRVLVLEDWVLRLSLVSWVGTGLVGGGVGRWVLGEWGLKLFKEAI